MKKRLLFVTQYLQTGGVEKSLITLLSEINYDKYNVDLLLFDHSGVWFDKVPSQVNILPPLFEAFSLPCLQAISKLVKMGKYRLLIGKLLAAMFARFSKGVGTGPRWAVYRYTLDHLKGHYDVAISYLDFFCNYYVIEKVNADKKILYNHMDYASGNGWPCPRLERKSFSKSHHIVSVAESARQSLASFFPEYADKMQVIHNSVSPKAVRTLAIGKPSEYIKCDAKFKIATVARLVDEKGVFLALKACKNLVNQGFDVTWFLVGDGPLRGELETRAKELGLDRHFHLLGEKENPYPYMAYCDVYVQPSKTEAHCVAVEEAMVLARPIVVTDIPSFRDQIGDEKTGMIVTADAVGIADGIKQLLDSTTIREALVNHLLKSGERNKEELAKFYQLLEA